MGMPEMENQMESQTDKDVFFGELAVWYARYLPWVPRCAKPFWDPRTSGTVFSNVLF